MRLLRLVSEDRNGLFDNFFHTDVEIKSGQEIALQSCSFSEQISSITIDNINNDISFKYSTTKTLNIKLDEVAYNGLNVEDLFTDITNKLNGALVLDSGKTIGMKFKAEASSTSDRSEISYQVSKKSNVSQRESQGQAELINAQANAGSPFRVHSTTTTSTNDSSKVFSRVPWSDGCMVFRCQLHSFVDSGLGSANGLTFGLSTISPDVWSAKDEMTQNEKSYFLAFYKNNEVYRTKSPTQLETDTAVTPQNVVNSNDPDGDYIEWSIDGSVLKCTIYQSDPDATTVVYSEPYTPGLILYPFCTFQGSSNNIKTSHMSWTIDPYHPNASLLDAEHFDVSTKPPAVRPTTVTINTLTMHGLLTSFLGYRNNINIVTARDVCLFQGDDIFKAYISNVSFIIELQNIQIESYNAQSGERQNIIAIVPQQSDISNHIIEYESNNLYFINVKNDFNIRNIKARILRIDGSQPLLSGLSVITLLIK